MPDTSVPAVVVSGLTKRFADTAAIDNVSFAVAEGEALALLGPSGCGKTTILRCIAGLEKPNDGRITIAGRTVFDAAAGINLLPEQRNLGVVFQSYAVWPHMTVAENVGFPLRIRKIDAGRHTAQVQRVLNAVGLGGLADRPATQLSGGQQQRVALARALVHEPSVVLFDEALSNLDKLLREQMRLELKALQDRLGFTAIYVTHDQDEALGLAGSLVLLDRGRVNACGATRTVFNCVNSVFSARFFGWNVVPGTVTEIAADGQSATVKIGTNLLRLKVSDVRPGTHVEVGIRREHVLMRTLPAAATTAAADRITGTLDTSSFQGLHNEYLVDIGGGLSIRALHPALDAKRGDEVEIVIAPENIVVWSDEGASQLGKKVEETS